MLKRKKLLKRDDAAKIRILADNLGKGHKSEKCRMENLLLRQLQFYDRKNILYENIKRLICKRGRRKSGNSAN